MSVEPGVSQHAVRQAEAAADSAAAAAGVTVRQAEPRDLAAVIGLFERTWGVGHSPDRSMLLALDFAGNTVMMATKAGKPVGATLGFLGWTDGIHLHSHMAAVVPWQRGSGVGYALKLFQRALCLQHGIADMRWTFDPLIRRNAHFNLVKLGAEVVRFLPDFYGRLDDVITGSDRSDRFEVRWRLDSPRTLRALAGELPPVWTGSDSLPLDVDFERLRADDPAEAVRRRDESRALFQNNLSRGMRPELTENNDYIFTPDVPDRRPAPD
ncbi:MULTISPECIES: GNAT family N-acetyltransferase [unclassified Cryobacterium]|uniref:GNAT family N-acetyltransferase n=1 Tax=unclassified Cryobacterium TaxID=2649013 RepID=UPI00106D5754|nr:MULTISPECIES: GNAT family N-acetyltransferase [unclassified Cryobacterium]TFC39791.1 GNAT family N-acetyltransferase [Cryobacterium sp. TMT2-42-4]TFC58327.1 GNAT family N-acetyltransferase [Cryobacterium sp. TMT2-15-1]